MRLRSKLVLAATAVTFAIVVVISMVFLRELLRQRITQTGAANEVLVRQVLLMTREAVATGLVAEPPKDMSDEALRAAVIAALRDSDPLNDTMNGLVRYSPAVQDVSVTDAAGQTLTSTDPQMVDRPAAARMSFNRVQDADARHQLREVFGQAHVLDVSAPLARNGKPFLVVHLGVRSTFLKNNYLPSLKDMFWLAVLEAVISMLAAGLLANVALRPMEEISRQLERLAKEEQGEWPAGQGRTDAVVRVTDTIDRLGRQMRTTEAGYTDLQANLNQMLDTLRDGVVLFTAEWRAVMVSDAVENFVKQDGKPLIGRRLTEIFAAETALGRAVLAAFERAENVVAETVRTEDGREVEISLDRIDDGGRGRVGTLLTLRDKGSALKLEQELEVSRRLAAVGRLTAGVGHEVKNPINAMVVHLELLKSKLETAGQGRSFLGGAMRHVEIVSSEMQRLDRVVQTLADFTRPLELDLRTVDLCDVADSVIELTGAEMAEHGVSVEAELAPVMVRADGELLRQALLNLVLNGMEAISENVESTGKRLLIRVSREHDLGVIQISDEGAGIAPEVMPRIFDLYFTTRAKGSGIGLAMTYRIVQMHGGAMEVASEPGHGAVFTVRLPSVNVVAGRAA